MKTIFSLSSLLIFSIIFISSCKKCQTCTTTTKQTVSGITQNTSVSTKYCGSDYDKAPAEGTVTNNVGSIVQEVTVSCD